MFNVVDLFSDSELILEIPWTVTFLALVVLKFRFFTVALVIRDISIQKSTTTFNCILLYLMFNKGKLDVLISVVITRS